MHAGLYGDDQITVCRGHDDRQDARQRQTCQADRQDLDRQRRDDCVGRAVGRELLRRDQLVRHDAHEPHQRDRQSVGQRPEEQPLLGRLAVLGSKGPLPHLRASEGEDEIGDDIADDAAVQIRLRQLWREILHKIADPAELDERRRRNEDIHEQDQHDELKDVRINNAEQAGGRRIDDEYRAGDERAHLIRDADLAAEHVDDRRSRRDLRGDSAHHRERDQAAEHDLGRLPETLLKQIRDGRDVEFPSDVGNTSGKAGEDKHPEQIRQRRHDGLEAAGIRNARTAHQAAAADDGRAYRGHQHQRPEGPSAQIIIVHALDLFDHDQANEHHGDQIGRNDGQIDRVNFVMNHKCLLSLPAGRHLPDSCCFRFPEKPGDSLPGLRVAHKNDQIAPIQLRVRAG